MAYSKTGPFITSSAPGIDSGFLNKVENYLNASVANCGVPIISKFGGTGTGSAQTVNHNLHDSNGASINPDVVIVQYAGNFGGAPTMIISYWNTTSTQVTILAQNSLSWNAIALKF
jgi:hypothetical protein